MNCIQLEECQKPPVINTEFLDREVTSSVEIVTCFTSVNLFVEKASSQFLSFCLSKILEIEIQAKHVQLWPYNLNFKLNLLNFYQIVLKKFAKLARIFIVMVQKTNCLVSDKG